MISLKFKNVLPEDRWNLNVLLESDSLQYLSVNRSTYDRHR